MPILILLIKHGSTAWSVMIQPALIKKHPPGAGMPKKEVDLKMVAENVGHTSRASCGACHFNGGGGDAIKHADMSRQLLKPDRNCDIHMGGYDFTCTECQRPETTRLPEEVLPCLWPKGGFLRPVPWRNRPITAVRSSGSPFEQTCQNP
jgi:hypothetical protein